MVQRVGQSQLIYQPPRLLGLYQMTNKQLELFATYFIIYFNEKEGRKQMKDLENQKKNLAKTKFFDAKNVHRLKNN